MHVCDYVDLSGVICLLKFLSPLLQVVQALQAHGDVYPGKAYAKNEKKVTLSQVKRLLAQAGSVALVWDLLKNMSKNKVCVCMCMSEHVYVFIYV
jgi:hypothetical protein